MKKFLILICIIFALALSLRVIGIASYPVGFTQDEAGIGYDAYSLALTGRDQWGKAWPLTLRSFGDFKLPLYSYITIPSVYFLGLTEFSVRLPGAILGSLAVVATYLMVAQMTKRKDFGLISALFLATSPWHISLSRGAFEANLTTFFIPLGVWAFLVGIEKPRFMILAAVSFGLNLFSYHSARFFTPGLVLVLLASHWSQLKRDLLGRYKWAVLILGVFGFLAVFSMFAGGAKRGLDITIIYPTDRWAALADRRYAAILGGAPEIVARVVSNKVIYVFDLFSKNYLSYFSSTYLFTQGTSEWSYGMIPGVGVLYFFEVLFVVSALISFARRKGFKNMGFIILWLLIAPIPAALTKGPGFAGTRAAVMMPAVQIISAWGALFLFDFIKEKYSKVWAKVFAFSLFAFLTISLAGFLENYRYQAPVKASGSMQYGMRELVATIDSIEGGFDEVVLSRTLSVPNIWVQFYNKVDPRKVQEASSSWLSYEEQGVQYLDQITKYSLGKYTFGDIVIRELRGRKALVVGRPSEFPRNTRPIATIRYLNGEVAFILVNANGL